MEPRPGANDGLTLAEGRREGPGRDDLVRFPKIFEEEPPIVRLFVPLRLEASGQDSRRRRGSDPRVELDLLPPAVPAASQAFRQARLDDERRRCARGVTLIG